jgi:hypothetical protein
LIGCLFKFNGYTNKIAYGSQAFVKDNAIHLVDKSAGDALFDKFLFDNKNKILVNIDPESRDSFADDFNRYYGGNRSLIVQKGNLMLDDEVLITAENSRITALRLPALTTMSDRCLPESVGLTQLELPALQTMGNYCFNRVPALVQIKAPVLTKMGNYCFDHTPALRQLEMPALQTMGSQCLYGARVLTQLELPALANMGNHCLYSATALKQLKAPALKILPEYIRYRIERKILHPVRTIRYFLTSQWY